MKTVTKELRLQRIKVNSPKQIKPGKLPTRFSLLCYFNTAIFIATREWVLRISWVEFCCFCTYSCNRTGDFFLGWVEDLGHALVFRQTHCQNFEVFDQDYSENGVWVNRGVLFFCITFLDKQKHGCVLMDLRATEDLTAPSICPNSCRRLFPQQ